MATLKLGLDPVPLKKFSSDQLVGISDPFLKGVYVVAHDAAHASLRNLKRESMPCLAHVLDKGNVEPKPVAQASAAVEQGAAEAPPIPAVGDNVRLVKRRHKADRFMNMTCKVLNALRGGSSLKVELLEGPAAGTIISRPVDHFVVDPPQPSEAEVTQANANNSAVEAAEISRVFGTPVPDL